MPPTRRLICSSPSRAPNDHALRSEGSGSGHYGEQFWSTCLQSVCKMALGPSRQREGEKLETQVTIHTGCGAAWLARLTGGQEVPGSNPGSPTEDSAAHVAADQCGSQTESLHVATFVATGAESASNCRLARGEERSRHRLGGNSLLAFEEVRVNVGGDGNTRVAQHLAHDLQRRSLRQHEGCA